MGKLLYNLLYHNSMFNHETQIDPSIDEGVVIEVDASRKLCKVKTITGRNLVNVRWLSPFGGSTRAGSRSVPVYGDSVLLSLGLGNPIILGFLPKVQTQDELGPVSINSNNTLIDTGNYGIKSDGAALDRNRPKEMVSGDQILSSPGGGLLAVLRGGSILVRSSRLAEVFLSKLQDLVRIVSRNFEHFTDVSSDVVRNFQNRVYRYVGYTKVATDARTENYTYHQFYGDVAAAMAIKTNYANYSGTPSTDDIIAKERVTDSTGVTEKMRREIHLDGKTDLVITNGANFTRVVSTGGDVQVTYNDSNVVKVNATELSLNYGTVNSIVVNGSSVTLSQNGNPTIVMNSSGIAMTFGTHYVNITGAGVSFG